MLLLKQAIAVFLTKIRCINRDWKQRKPDQYMSILPTPWKTPEQQLPQPEMSAVVSNQTELSCNALTRVKRDFVCAGRSVQALLGHGVNQ